MSPNRVERCLLRERPLMDDDLECITEAELELIGDCVRPDAGERLRLERRRILSCCCCNQFYNDIGGVLVVKYESKIV